MRDAPDTGPGPLVVFGLDAGDASMIERWAGEGRLPTIASLMQRGCWGRTGGSELISEHGVWNCLLSGVSRARHGHYYFRQLVPGTYDLAAVTGQELGVDPIWAYLRGSGLSASVVDVPEFPLVHGLPGVQLTDWATHQGWDPGRFPLASEPSPLAGEAASQFGPQRTTIEELVSSPENDRRLLDEILRRVTTRGELLRWLLARDACDLLVAVFAESHSAGHQLWAYQPGLPGPKPGGDEMLASAIRTVYEAIDHELGRTLAVLPPDANVVVVSSVGLGDYFPTSGVTSSFLQEFGFQHPAEPGGVSLQPLAVARRILPERMRVAMSRRLPRETRERLLADQFRSGTDWSRTQAFAIPSPYTSLIRLNLRGREPQGIVEPGSDAEAVLDGLEHELGRLTDPVTGEAAVRRVARTRELFGADVSDALPDLFVEWKPGRFMEQVAHPSVMLTNARPEFFRRSDHVHEGFFAIAGPSVSRGGCLPEISVLDLAPTFLTLLGLPIPDDLTGTPLVLR